MHTIRVEVPRYKKEATKRIRDMVLEKAQEQSRDLVMGGEFARLLEEQESNVEWRSLIHSLPRGLLGPVTSTCFLPIFTLHQPVLCECGVTVLRLSLPAGPVLDVFVLIFLLFIEAVPILYSLLQ